MTKNKDKQSENEAALDDAVQRAQAAIEKSRSEPKMDAERWKKIHEEARSIEEQQDAAYRRDMEKWRARLRAEGIDPDEDVGKSR